MLINPYVFSRLWTPLDDLPDLWFRASDINQSNTSTWNESQGRLTLNRKTTNVVFETFGNQTSVNFVNGTGYAGTYSVANLSGLTIIVCGYRPAIAGNKLDPLISWQTNNSFTTDILFSSAENSAGVFMQVNSGVDGASSATWPSTSVVGMFMARYNGQIVANNGKIEIWYNESNLAATADYTVPSSIPPNMSSTFRIANYNDDNWMNGGIADVLIYKRSISTDLQQRIAGWSSWLSGAWSLPTGHPYKNSAPRI